MAEPLPRRSAPARISAIVVAGGTGSRAAGPDGLPKQYQVLDGVPMLRRTLAALIDHPSVDRVTCVIHPDFEPHYRAATAGLAKLTAPAFGAATRQASVLAGLEALAGDPPDAVLIHDGARPFLPADAIDRIVAALQRGPAALLAVPVTDTLKRVDGAQACIETVPRAGLWGAQTPQGFAFDAILDAHRRAARETGTEFTDDTGVAEWAGMVVEAVPGDVRNIKITTAADLAQADRRLRMEAFAALADIRVGTGYDVHSFEPGDHVTLCGVAIPHEARLNGHSDADVALHALTDAILGALGDGDIGSHFPPSDMQWRGAASEIFVRHAMDLLAKRGGRLAHADISIVAEAPKIGPHREAMRARVAAMLGVTLDRVGVKATTNEKLGFVGRREGIAAIATATVRLPL